MIMSNSLKLTGVFTVICLMAGSAAAAEDAEQKGLTIARLADRADVGWGSYRAKGEMVLRDAQGVESVRALESLNLERNSEIEGDWLLIVFRSPLDIKGVISLTHSKIEPQNDDQWLYLPVEKRVKRISSSNRAGKFVSSEFSFEDLSSQEVKNYTYKWLRDESCPSNSVLTCHVLDTFPRNSRSGYSRRTVWVDNTAYRQWQIQFFNRRGDLEKTLNSTEFQQYNNRHWRPSRITMINNQTGKSTVLMFSGYQFNIGLSPEDFNPERMPSFSN